MPRLNSSALPLNDCAAKGDPSPAKRYDVTRLWRRRPTVLLSLATLVVLLTMISAVADPSGFVGVVSESGVESETGEPNSTRDIKFEKRHKSLQKKANPGLTRMNQQPSVSRLTGRLLQRLPLRHDTGRRFTVPDSRRALVSSACTNKDISIFQSPDGSSGIPRYTVQIMNNCMAECAPSNIHVSCGWFASALLVNPNSFQRLAFDDCIVNGGRPLKRGETLRFTYANSFMYELRFKSASFCR